jgi:hypothetical protein
MAAFAEMPTSRYATPPRWSPSGPSSRRTRSFAVVEEAAFLAWGRWHGPSAALHLELLKRSRLQSTKRRDGWVVLTAADLQRLGLGDRKARQRAIHRAAQQGWLEVRRSDGPQSKYAYRLRPGAGLPRVVNLDEERERQ